MACSLSCLSISLSRSSHSFSISLFLSMTASIYLILPTYPSLSLESLRLRQRFKFIVPRARSAIAQHRVSATVDLSSRNILRHKFKMRSSWPVYPLHCLKTV